MKIIERQAIIAQRIMQDHATWHERDICARALKVLSNASNSNFISTRGNLISLVVCGASIYHIKQARIEFNHTFGDEKIALVEATVNNPGLPNPKLSTTAKAALLIGKASFLTDCDEPRHVKQHTSYIDDIKRQVADLRLSDAMKREAKKVFGM